MIRSKLVGGFLDGETMMMPEAYERKTESVLLESKETGDYDYYSPTGEYEADLLIWRAT